MAIFRPEQAMSASLSIPVTGHPKPIYESIGGRFSDIATHFPNRVAVTSGPLSWTYSELEDHSNAIASKVLDLSDEHAKTVALLMKQDAPLVAATLGVLKAGKIYLSLDATLPNARLADILNNSGATLLITDPDNVALAKSLAREKIRILEYTPESLHSPARAPDIAVPPDSGAWLMYTSGSTGTPKGVWQNHRNVLYHADLYRALIKSVPDDRFTLLTSFSLAASATHLFAALTSGAQLCLFSVRTHGVARLAEWITAERITVYHSVPTIFRRMMRARATASPYQSVRLIRLGGEPMRREDVDLFRQGFVPSARLMNALSSTETGLFSFLFLDHETPPESDPLPVGRPASGTEVVLLDEQRRPVPQGAEGTIAVRSPYLARGYWNQPQQSHEVFRDSLPGIPSGPPLFLSNDRGRFRPDGLLVHLGRSDQLIKIRGQRLDLNEVEYALRATDLFEESAVVAITKQSGDHHLVAVFVSKQGASPSTETCRKSLLPLLPEAFIPAEFVPVESMPLTAGGKLDRQELKRLLERTRQNRSGSAALRDDLERTLGRIWQEELRIPRIGRDEDFFKLGGDSLQSLQVLTRVEETFNVALSPSALAENGTIEKLAGLVARHALGHSHDLLVPLRTAAAGRPLFLVHNGQGSVAGYGQLVRHLKPRPIFGFQAPGLLGERWPLTRIRTFAKCYLRKILATDPTGPYLLGGACSGGIIAYEIAQQLRAGGKPVALLALFDSRYPLLPSQRARWRDRTFGTFLHGIRDGGRSLRWSLLRGLTLHRTSRWLPEYRHFVANLITSAYRRYRPLPYPGSIAAFLSSDTEAMEDRRLTLAQLGKSADVMRIPVGRPQLFIPPGVIELARNLDRSLDQALARYPSLT